MTSRGDLRTRGTVMLLRWLPNHRLRFDDGGVWYRRAYRGLLTPLVSGATQGASAAAVS